MVARTMAILVLAGLVLPLTPGRAQACSCASPNDSEVVHDIFRASTEFYSAIVVGEVREVGDERVLFSVERVYSGDVPDQLVLPAVSGAQCTFAFGDSTGDRAILTLAKLRSGEGFAPVPCASYVLDGQYEEVDRFVGELGPGIGTRSAGGGGEDAAFAGGLLAAGALILVSVVIVARRASRGAAG